MSDGVGRIVLQSEQKRMLRQTKMQQAKRAKQQSEMPYILATIALVNDSAWPK